MSYELDQANRLVSYDPAFARFARRNGIHPDRLETPVPLSSFIRGDSDLHLHRWLLDLARDRPEGLRYRYRCDEPGVFRLCEMALMGLDEGGVRLTSVTLEERPLRDADLVPLPPLPVCAWCDRVAPAGSWVEVDSTVLPLETANPNEEREITHGICPDCAVRFVGEDAYEQLRGSALAPGSAEEGPG